MRKLHISLIMIVSVTVAMMSLSHAANQKTEAMDKALVASAISAAPPAVGSEAAVVAMEADGTIKEANKEF